MINLIKMIVVSIIDIFAFILEKIGTVFNNIGKINVISVNAARAKQTARKKLNGNNSQTAPAKEV